MRFIRNLSRLGKVGLIIFVIINGSFIFLLLSPIIPNLIGEFRDNQLLAGCDDRIQQYRTGPVQIQLRNQTTGVPIQGWNISFTHIKHDFIFGCNIYAFDSFSEPGYNQLYRDYFENLFNLAVIGFYWSSYEPTQGIFPTESNINATIAWCKQNNITTKGHPLAWTRPAGTPSWLPLDNNSLMADLLQNHIETIVSKYKTLIDHWDVVNEPIHTETFAQLSRTDYVHNSLLWANASNPDAHLTVNDYGILGHDFGFGPFYNLLNELNTLNAPYDSIGMQFHEPRTDWVPATEIWRTLDAYQNLGKPIHITEFAPISAPVPITNSWKKGLWSEEAQGEYVERIYQLCFSHPAMQGIIWWDLTDLKSWLEGGGLLRANMTPKPAYTVLDQLINQEWRTNGFQLSNSSGWIDFRGYYGLYNISINNGLYNFQIKVESGKQNQFIFNI